MDWDEYKEKFIHYSKYLGKSDYYINVCLNYGKILFDKKLPIIYDVKHFSLLVGFNEAYLMKASNSPSHFYREFKIPKKRESEYRIISEPLPNLKEIQRWILDEILYSVEPSPYSKAYRPGYSIKDNAKYHRKQKCVLTIDIKNYFSSIDSQKVINFFLNLGYSRPVAVVLTNLCVLNNGLPQGGPTSAMLSNLVTKNIDDEIGRYTQQHNIRYTRYADDLTFSGDFREDKTIKFVNKVLKTNGFIVNELKTRTRRQSQQQEVTGIVVNEKLQVSKCFRRSFRQKIFYIKKYGLESHMNYKEEKDKLHSLQKLLGTANFIVNINPNDIEAKENLEYLKHLYAQHRNDN